MNRIIKLEENTRLIQNQARAFVEKYALQLYRRTGHGKLEGHASAFLIQYSGCQFAISAGHIFEKVRIEEIGPMVGNKFVRMASCSINLNSNPTSEKLLKEHDFTVWKLNKDAAELLGAKWNFYPLFPADLKPVYYEDQFHFAYGFPASKTVLKMKTKELNTTPHFLSSTLADDGAYAKLNCRKEWHYVLHMNRKRARDIDTGMEFTAPYPAGMSGCPLWALPNAFSTVIDESSLKLVGLISHFYEKEKYLVANRLSNLRVALDTLSITNG